jgi:hypothetical protein
MGGTNRKKSCAAPASVPYLFLRPSYLPQVPLCQRADALHGLTLAQCLTFARKKLWNHTILTTEIAKGTETMSCTHGFWR